jgi:hypothetical protein
MMHFFVRLWRVVWALAPFWRLLWMSFTAPPTKNSGDDITATLWNTYVRDNINYLINGRPKAQIIREGVANYTTSSTSFVALDTTNLRITLTVNSGIAVIEATGVVQHSDTSSGSGAALGGRISLDIIRDGSVRLGGTNGLLTILQSNNGSAMHAFHIKVRFTGLSVGSHTFDLAWRTSGATATMYNNGYVITMLGEERG